MSVDAVASWGAAWKVTFEPSKTQALTAHHHRQPLALPCTRGKGGQTPWCYIRHAAHRPLSHACSGEPSQATPALPVQGCPPTDSACTRYCLQGFCQTDHGAWLSRLDGCHLLTTWPSSAQSLEINWSRCVVPHSFPSAHGVSSFVFVLVQALVSSTVPRVEIPLTQTCKFPAASSSVHSSISIACNLPSRSPVRRSPREMQKQCSARFPSFCHPSLE